jgi:hypothetical protein
MATRRDIREAFYADLEVAVDGLVAAENIGQEYPNEDEAMPAVVHRDNYRDVPMNTKTGIVDTVEDADGVQEEIYSSLREARFSLLVVSDDEQEKENIYESLVGYFEDYEYPVKDASSLHTDVNTIRVTDSNSEDTENRDPPARGDRLSVNVQFQRFRNRDVTPAEEVTLNQDADNDGTDDNTYTTT